MKWSLLLLSGAALITAGCASSNSNEYATYGEYGYTFDLVPQPVPGITVAEVRELYGTAEVQAANPAKQNAGPSPYVNAQSQY